MFTNQELRSILHTQLKLNADNNKPDNQISIARECIKLSRAIYQENQLPNPPE